MSRMPYYNRFTLFPWHWYYFRIKTRARRLYDYKERASRQKERPPIRLAAFIMVCCLGLFRPIARAAVATDARSIQSVARPVGDTILAKHRAEFCYLMHERFTRGR